MKKSTTPQKLAYREETPQPGAIPIVFVHGTPSASREFLQCYEILKTRGPFRFLAADHLGFGHSDKPADGDYTLEGHRARFEAWVNSLELAKLHLVVHDFGGPIGLPWAIKNSTKLQSLTLINTWFWPFEQVDPGFEKQRKVLASGLMKWLYLSLNISPRFLVKMAWGKRTPLTKEQRAAFVSPFNTKADRAGLYGFVRALVDKHDYWEKNPASRLATLQQVPAAIIWGMADPLIKPAHLTEWRRYLPNARVTELKDVGHFPLLEAPGEVAEVISNMAELG